jgi:hypothetical protein
MNKMLFLGFLAHLWGDYIFQNHWMAVRKKTKLLAAFLHALFYSMPFIVFVYLGHITPLGLLIIGGTHMLIDYFGIQKVLTFLGIGVVNGFVPRLFSKLDLPTDPELNPPPPFLSVWLAIIVDNIFHITINSVVLLLGL